MIEGDGTPVEPVEVSSVSVAVAQRYSVLLRTNQTAGAYWMRAALDTTQFTVRRNAACAPSRAMLTVIFVASTTTRGARLRSAVSSGMAWMRIRCRTWPCLTTRPRCRAVHQENWMIATSSPSDAAQRRILRCTWCSAPDLRGE